MTKIIESLKDFGTMNEKSISINNLTETDKNILSMLYNIDKEELEHTDLMPYKKDIFELHRREMASSMGFDANKMFMADQEHKKGSFFEITRDYVEANPKGWTDIPEDILVVTSKTPRVVIGHPVADCPVVMMIDKKQGISAIGHCGAEMIDKHLPIMIQEVLRRDYGSRADDIYTYVSSCIGENWTYDCFPKWAKDAKVWNNCIFMGDDGLFHINIKPAIMSQLLISGLDREKILFSTDNTKSNPNYYSNNASKEDKSKEGRHFAGMFYTDDENQEIEIQKGRSR